MPLIRPAVALAALCAAACPAAAEPLVVGTTFLTNGVDPTRGSNGWALVSHGIGENLFWVDRDGTLSPQLAERAERMDDDRWRVTLRAGRFFANGEAVTAGRVARALNHTIETNPIAKATGGTLVFSAVDDRTLDIVTERPVPVIEALLAEWPLVVYDLQEDGTSSFTGPYDPVGFTPDVSIDLEPNAHHEGARDRSPVELRRFSDGQALALAFEAGELDLAFGLPSESVARLEGAGRDIRDFAVAYQYYAFLNTERPALGDVRVRQAIDLAFDREELALAIGGGEPATGAFASYFPFADDEPRAFDAARAAALLDEAGWTLNASGLREKDGETLRLQVLAYPQRPDLVSMQPVVAAQFARLGITTQTQVVENAGPVADGGEFDLFLWAQHTAPSGDPAFFLNSMLRSGAPLNYAGYDSPAFDAVLDRLAQTGRPDERADLARQAQAILFEEVPISFLLSPVWYVGVSDRLGGYEPWGSDYHVLRDDIGETR